jgi:hypothetical protein
MKTAIITILKPFADLCFELVSAVPLAVAVVIYIAVLVVTALWVLTLKAEKPRADRKSFLPLFLHDLRLYAVLILIVQAVIYVVFR